MSKLLNLELEYNNFLDAVGLSDLEKDSVQYKQLKKTFFSGMMCMFGKLAFELPEMEEEEANQELQDMFSLIKNGID